MKLTPLLTYSNGNEPNGGHYNKLYTLLDLVFYPQSKINKEHHFRLLLTFY